MEQPTLNIRRESVSCDELSRIHNLKDRSFANRRSVWHKRVVARNFALDLASNRPFHAVNGDLSMRLHLSSLHN